MFYLLLLANHPQRYRYAKIFQTCKTHIPLHCSLLFWKVIFKNYILYSEYALTELLTKAYHCADPIERMKYVVAFAISGIHCSPDLCRSKAPFNPIVGETYQARIPDGSMLYMEQTLHVPLTLNYNICWSG